MTSRKRIDIEERKNFFGLVEFEGGDISYLVVLAVGCYTKEGEVRAEDDKGRIVSKYSLRDSYAPLMILQKIHADILIFF
jgi:hypothetical protein